MLPLRLIPLALAALLASPATAQDAGPSVALTYEPAGFAVYPIPTRAVEAAWFPGPDGSLSLSYAKGSAEQLQATYTAELLLLRYRRHFGLSHLNAGLGARTLGYERPQVIQGEDTVTKISSTMAVAEASFGNQVTLGPLVLGCDWAGAAVPLTRLKSRSDIPDSYDEEEKEASEEAARRVAFVATMQFMRVYVGAQF